MSIIENYLNKMQTLVEVKSIKDISINEAHQLKPLLKKFGKETKETSYFKYKNQPYEQWISQFQKGKKVKLLMAFEDNIAIGFIIGEIKEDRTFKSKSGHVSAMYLEPKYRGTGLADKLFSQIVEWINSNDVKVIRVRTMGANVHAQNFYKKMNFIPELIVLRNKNSKGVIM